MPPTVVRSLGPPLGPPALPPIRPSALATVPLPPLHAVVPVLALSSRALLIGAPSIRGSTCRALPFLYRLPMSLFAALLVVVPVLFPSTTVSFLFFPRFLSIAFLAFGLSYIKFLPSSCPCPCPPGVRARLVFVPAWCPCPPVSRPSGAPTAVVPLAVAAPALPPWLPFPFFACLFVSFLTPLRRSFVSYIRSGSSFFLSFFFLLFFTSLPVLF